MFASKLLDYPSAASTLRTQKNTDSQANEGQGGEGWSDSSQSFDAVLAGVREQSAQQTRREPRDSNVSSSKNKQTKDDSQESSDPNTATGDAGTKDASLKDRTAETGSSSAGADTRSGDSKKNTKKDKSSDHDVSSDVAAVTAQVSTQPVPVLAKIAPADPAEATAATSHKKPEGPHVLPKIVAPKLDAKVAGGSDSTDPTAADGKDQASGDPSENPSKDAFKLETPQQAARATHSSDKDDDATSPTANTSSGASDPQAAQAAVVLAELFSPDDAATGDPIKSVDKDIKPASPSGSVSANSAFGSVSGTGGAPDSAAEIAHPAQDSPSADPAGTFDQIVLGLKGKMDARSGKAEIRLDPPNLGALRVSVTLENGQLTAQFQSPSETVRGLLRDNLEKLKTVLEGQGVTVDRLAVEATPDAQTQGGQGSGQPSFGSAAHDGRSAGQYQQDPRSQQQRGEPSEFSRLLNQANEAPLDLVA